MIDQRMAALVEGIGHSLQRAVTALEVIAECLRHPPVRVEVTTVEQAEREERDQLAQELLTELVVHVGADTKDELDHLADQAFDAADAFMRQKVKR